VAEDAVSTCKRGHPRTPENVGTDRSCKACRAAYNAAYKAIHAEAYRASSIYWLHQRKQKLRGAREAIHAKLEALAKEEECLTSRGYPTPMQSS